MSQIFHMTGSIFLVKTFRVVISGSFVSSMALVFVKEGETMKPVVMKYGSVVPPDFLTTCDCASSDDIRATVEKMKKKELMSILDGLQVFYREAMNKDSMVAIICRQIGMFQLPVTTGGVAPTPAPVQDTSGVADQAKAKGSDGSDSNDGASHPPAPSGRDVENTKAVANESKWTDELEKKLQMLEKLNEGAVNVDSDVLARLRKQKQEAMAIVDASSEDKESEADETVVSLNERGVNTVGKAIVYMKNNVGDTKTYQFFYVRETTFKELYDLFFIKTNVAVDMDSDMKLVSTSNSPTFSYESMSSWGVGENFVMELKVIASGLSGGGKRGYGASAVSKGTWDDKTRALKDTLDILGLRVQGTNVAQVNAVLTMVNQAKTNALTSPSTVMTDALQPFSVETLKKVQGTLFQTNLDSKLTALTRLFFADSLTQLENVKIQHDAMMEAAKHVIHMMCLSEFHVGDAPQISWQAFSDVCVNLISTKSAVPAQPADATM